MQYTEQQQVIIESKEKKMNIGAAPGAGKTSVILGVVNHHKQDNHLIMCFNAPIKESIREKIEKSKITNAEVYTFHGLAYDFFMNSDIIKNFKDRKIEDMDFFTMEPIMKKLGFDYKKTSLYVSVLNEFFSSSKDTKSFFIEDTTFKGEPSENFREILKHMKNDEKCPVFHSFYIKVFQLMKFKTTKYETVLVDEAQDVNECYESIIENINSNRVIKLGDSAQKIYGFNGAIGMDEINFKLSNSFRIGKDSSDMCNRLIADFIKDETMFFDGLNEKSIVVDDFDQLDKITIIYRTNKKMLKRLVEECERGKVCTIVGGKATLGLSTVEGIYRATEENPFWYKGKKITNQRDAERLCALTKSPDLKRALEFINEFKYKTLSVVNKINVYTVDDADYADFRFTTAHRSKGLEFKNVELGNDYPNMSKLYEFAAEGRPHIDEIYVLYVALSRCYGKMKLNNDLKQWFELVKTGRGVKKIESTWEEVDF